MDLALIATSGVLSTEEAESARTFFIGKMHDTFDELEKNQPGGRVCPRNARLLTVTLSWRTVSYDNPAAIKILPLDVTTSMHGKIAIGVAMQALAFEHFKGDHGVLLGGSRPKPATAVAA